MSSRALFYAFYVDFFIYYIASRNIYIYIYIYILSEVLSINSSANVLVFGDFNVYRKGWFIRTYSIGTDRRGKLCYNLKSPYFSARIPDFDSHSPALLDLFFSLA